MFFWDVFLGMFFLGCFLGMFFWDVLGGYSRFCLGDGGKLVGRSIFWRGKSMFVDFIFLGGSKFFFIIEALGV